MSTILKQFTLFFCICLTILLGLAVFGYFNFASVLFVVLLFLFGFLLSLFYLFRNKKFKVERFDVYIIIGIVLFALFLSFFHHGLPDGRDDASYMSSAIMLTQTGSLSFTDKLTHAFSGFRNLSGDDFTSQFLPGYVVYLGVYFLFGNINVMLWANLLLIILFLSLAYFIVKKLYSPKTGLLFLLIFATSYTAFWFTRRLNSENLFMVLFWFAVFLVIDGLKNKKFNSFCLSLYPLFLACLVRAETVFYFLMLVILIAAVLIKKSWREYFFGSKLKIKNTWLTGSLLILSAIIFGFYLKIYNGLSYFYKQFYNPWQLFSKFIIIFFIILVLGLILYLIFRKSNQGWLVNSINFVKTNFQKIILCFLFLSAVIYEIILLAKGNDLAWSFYQIQFNFKALGCYFVLFYLIIILLGLNKKLFDKWELILAILILPSFLFLIRAQIAIDQPWFMRRFFSVFLPFVFILVSAVWYKLKLKDEKLFKYAKTCIVVIIIISFLTCLPIAFYSENVKASDQIEKIAKQFKNDDLLIMDPGWRWQKWAYALHYLYGVNVIPRSELASKAKFVDEIEKKKNNLENDQIIVDLKNLYDTDSFEKLKEIINDYDNVYFMIDKSSLIIYPYKPDNLEKISEIKLEYPNFYSDSYLIKYLKDKNIKKKDVAKRLFGIPLILSEDVNFDLTLYKALDKNNLILPQRIYGQENIEEYRDYFEKLIETDF